MVGVGHQEAAGGVDGDVLRFVESGGVGEPGGDDALRLREHGHLVVLGVGHEDVTVVVGGDALGPVEATGDRAGDGDAVPVAVGQLDHPVVLGVGHQDVTVGRVHGDAARLVELAAARALDAEHPDEGPAGDVVDLDAVVERVGHPGGAVGLADDDRVGPVELVAADPEGTELRDRGAVGLDDVEVVLLGVGHPDLAGGLVDGDAPGPVELAGGAPAHAAGVDDRAVGVHADDAVVDGVGHGDDTRGVEGDPSRLLEHRRVGRGGDHGSDGLGVGVAGGRAMEPLDPPPPQVGAPDVAGAVGGDRHPPQLEEGAGRGGRAGGADPGDERPVSAELLDPVVVGVGHVDGLGAEHGVGGQPHAVEGPELTVARSRRPPGGGA